MFATALRPFLDLARPSGALRLPGLVVSGLLNRVPGVLDRVGPHTLALDPWLAADVDTETFRAALVRRLAEGVSPNTTIEIGGRAEAWASAELVRGRTRAVLELLARTAVKGSVPAEVKVQVQSSAPGIARDAAVLAALDRHRVVEVRLRVSGSCARWLEAVRLLAAEGLDLNVELDFEAADPFGLVADLRAAGARRLTAGPRRSPGMQAAVLAGD